MLFNSYPFLFGFLPITLVVFLVLIHRAGARAAQIWLACASVLFYAWSGWQFLFVLFGSILFNWQLGRTISKAVNNGKRPRIAFLTAISANLLLLGYFKYAIFLDTNLAALTGSSLGLHDIVLPVGISFYTFTQIAFIADVYRGNAAEYRLSRYILFVTFFPHLIAGPIIHHKEMMPQFARQQRVKLAKIATGITIFAIGLFKKVMIADRVARYASPVFGTVAFGHQVTSFEAWSATLAYGLQIYFDFSGYTDMAIGLSLLFGIKLPQNFHSPYKAVSIIDFWRRWHMTLSRFLRDYVYIPLGGNRKGELRRYLNLLLTMLIGGLWHGAGWTFIVWGAVHGAMLAVNHAWDDFRSWMASKGRRIPPLQSQISTFITFGAVLFAWVPFRASDIKTTLSFWRSMLFLDGITFPTRMGEAMPTLASKLSPWLHFSGANSISVVSWAEFYAMAAILMVVIWAFPNTQQLLSRYTPVIDQIYWNREAKNAAFRLRLNWITLSLAVVAFVSAAIYLKTGSEFIYFNF